MTITHPETETSERREEHDSSICIGFEGSCNWGEWSLVRGSLTHETEIQSTDLINDQS